MIFQISSSCNAADGPADELKKRTKAANSLLSYEVVPRGFEPRQTESKSVVLPLYYGTILKCKSKGK